MLAALQEAGLSERQILMTAGLPSRLFDDPARRVPAPDYLRLWHAVRAVSGDPNIGITLARLLRPELTEPLVLAIVSAASVADAVEVMSTYKRLLCAEDIDVRTDAETGQLTLTYRWPPLEVAMPQVLVDTELAFIVETCRRATGCPGLTPEEIRLRARALEAGADHASFFRCPLRLGCAENSIVFAAADAVRPFVTFNPQMLGALLPHLRATAPVVAKSPVEQARSAIAERLQGPRPTVHGVARQLTMSARALQRILKDSGTSYRQLLDEVRNDHARDYLRSTSFTDGEVAFLVGFEDPNSFYRAFRSWNGMSPRQFRLSTTRPPADNAQPA
ncbi:MAG TPA: AraC family transcriptional regulator [Pilimelia sp.]|nr:AraC family transcriptional regulator [Pilimelia sp.]